MSTLQPDRSARRALAASAGGSPDGLNELEGKLYDCLRGLEGLPVDEDVSEAYALSRSVYRHVLNALLLVKAEIPTIASGLDMTEACITAYRDLFFDVRVFRNAFQVRTFISNLVDDDTEEFKSYNLALVEGADSLIDRYRVGEAPPPDPKVVVSRAVREFMSRSREHRGQRLTSKAAQESLRCARDAVSASSHLHNISPSTTPGQQAELQWRLALVPNDTTIPAASAPVLVTELVRSGPAPQ